jgi:hypothetical protein
MFYYIENSAIATGSFSLNSSTARKLTQCGNPENLSEAALQAVGIYPQWRESGDAPLGYQEPVWEPENARVAIYLNGTEQEREQAAEAQAAAQAEQEAIAVATARASEIAGLAAVDAQLDEMPDDEVALLTFVYPAWSGEGVALEAEQKVRYNGVLYRVVQAHTTQADWTPDATPALFARYREPTAAPEPWVQPTGAQDAYKLGEQVTHNGSTWQSTADNNVWEPGVYGWVQVS